MIRRYRSKPIKAKHLRQMDHQALCEQLEAGGAISFKGGEKDVHTVKSRG